MRGGMRMHTVFKTAWDRSRQKSASVPSRPVHQALERPASGVVCKVLAKEVYVEITGIAQRHVTGDMRGENQVPGLPQGMVFRQRFRDHYIQGCSCEASFI